NAAALSQIRRMIYPPKPVDVALILPEKETRRTKFPCSEISWGRRIIAVPIDNLSVFVFQESQQAAVRSVPQVMASGLNGVPGFDSVGCHSHSLESRAAGCFQGPHLGLALGIFGLQ